MSSQFPPKPRRAAGRWIIALRFAICVLLSVFLTELVISAWLSFLGVVYSVLADGFTPNSPVKDCHQPEEGGGPQKSVADPRELGAADAVPVTFKYPGESSRACSHLVLAMLAVMPAVAIILDSRDFAVRKLAGVARGSRR